MTFYSTIFSMRSRYRCLGFSGASFTRLVLRNTLKTSPMSRHMDTMPQPAREKKGRYLGMISINPM